MALARMLRVCQCLKILARVLVQLKLLESLLRREDKVPFNLRGRTYVIVVCLEILVAIDTKAVFTLHRVYQVGVWIPNKGLQALKVLVNALIVQRERGLLTSVFAGGSESTSGNTAALCCILLIPQRRADLHFDVDTSGVESAGRAAHSHEQPTGPEVLRVNLFM
jgi:hypothetical protein